MTDIINSGNSNSTTFEIEFDLLQTSWDFLMFEQNPLHVYSRDSMKCSYCGNEDH